MKRFLLVLGILLCLQGCAFARNLRDFGNGFYADLDSLKKLEITGMQIWNIILPTASIC